MTETHPGPSPGQLQGIRENTRLLAAAFAEFNGEPVPLGGPGIVCLADFIERQRERLTADALGALPDIAGSYLGEALIAEFGGRWINHSEYGLGVQFEGNSVALPFAKAVKHFANGAEDSVLSLLNVTRTLLSRHAQGPSDPSR